MTVSVDVEIQRNRKGEQTGLIVTVGKKKHKVDSLAPSLLVEVDGKSSSVTELGNANEAQTKVELMNKNMKRNPVLFLKSPEHVFALESDEGAYSIKATFSRDEAKRLYDQKVKIDEAFRVNLKKING